MSNRIRLVQSSTCVVTCVEDDLNVHGTPTGYVRVRASGCPGSGKTGVGWICEKRDQPRVGQWFRVSITEETK